MSSDLTFSVKVDGMPNTSDLRGLRREVRLENSRIDRENSTRGAEVLATNLEIKKTNVERLAQDPPLDPLPLLVFEPIPRLPDSTDEELLQSYSQLLGVAVVGVHAAAIQRALDAPAEITPTEQKDLQVAISERLEKGDSVADILADINKQL